MKIEKGAPRRRNTTGRQAARKTGASAVSAIVLPVRRAETRKKRAFPGYHAESAKQIERIRETLHLSGPELAAIFDVSRQAVDQWLEKGVPVDKAAAIDRVAEAVDELANRFKLQRLPAIVRNPMPILDNRSIIETLRDDGAAAIFEFFRRWSSYVPDVAPIRKGETFR